MIYLDHAATTPTDARVLEAMLPYFYENFGNPSAIYSFSQRARHALNDAREAIADTIGAKPSEIYFTSGGTEADNWAVKGLFTIPSQRSEETSKGHIITSSIEHHALLHSCQEMEKRGHDVTYLPVDREGRISIKELERALRPDTALISIMTGNNEIGSLQPVASIGQLARSRGIYFHTDAVQAYGQLSIDVERDKVDLLSASAHKLQGPKGIGFLYVRSGVPLKSLIHGGAQERGRRAGTENLPAIIGMAKAAVLAHADREKKISHIRSLRDHFLRRVFREIPDVQLHGPASAASDETRLPGIANLCFSGADAESILIMLDAEGICASFGSACSSGSLKPSHVLLSIGKTAEEAKSSVRFSIGPSNTMREMDETIDRLKAIVAGIRKMNAGGL